jgi:hypothetical protein
VGGQPLRRLCVGRGGAGLPAVASGWRATRSSYRAAAMSRQCSASRARAAVRSRGRATSGRAGSPARRPERGPGDRSSASPTCPRAASSTARAPKFVKSGLRAAALCSSTAASASYPTARRMPARSRRGRPDPRRTLRRASRSASAFVNWWKVPRVLAGQAGPCRCQACPGRAARPARRHVRSRPPDRAAKAGRSEGPVRGRPDERCLIVLGLLVARPSICAFRSATT